MLLGLSHDLFVHAVELFPCAGVDGRAPHQILCLIPQAAGVLHQYIPQGHVAAVVALVTDGVFLAEIFGLDDDVGHALNQIGKGLFHFPELAHPEPKEEGC